MDGKCPPLQKNVKLNFKISKQFQDFLSAKKIKKQLFWQSLFLMKAKMIF
jgi:hypothetical protein